MSGGSRIAKNTTYLTIASIIQKIISFGYYAFLAKAIGTEQLGQYDFALKFTSVFVIFMDFGLGPLLTREVAKEEAGLQKQFRQIFSIKIVLILLSLLALLVSAQFSESFFANINGSDVQLIYVGAFIIVFDTLTFTLFSVFRALKKLHWESIGIVIYQTTILVGGFSALAFDLPLIFVMGALLIGSAVQFFYMFVVILKKAGLSFRFEWEFQHVKKILAMSAPFAFAGIIFRLNGTADSLMLKTMIGDSATGWYALAFKLTFALTVLPGAFATSYFPAVSTLFTQSKERLHTVFESGVFYMLLLSFPIVAGVFVLGDDVIVTVWGEAWEASVQPLFILIAAVPFIFLNYPVGNFLNAVDKQQLNTVNMFIALLVNISLNFVLIPFYSFTGAAIAAFISSVVLVLLGAPWVYTVAPYDIGFIVKKFFFVSIAAGMMAFVLYFIQNNYPLFILIPLGAIIYAVSLFLVGAITTVELQALKKALLKRG